MKRICILLNGGIKYDQRVIKTIRALSEKFKIDLFYINGSKEDYEIFNSNVILYNILNEQYNNLKKQILRNSFFFFEFNYFIKCVIKKNKKYDYIWCNDLPTLYPGFKLSKYYKCKLIYDSHEIFNETLNQFFPTPRKLHHSIRLKFMQSTGKIIERFLVKRINSFVTVNESLKNYFVNAYNYVKPIHVIYNYPSNLNKMQQTNLNIRKELGLKKNDFVFIFQGTLNQGRGLLVMLNAFKMINDDKVKLLVAGGGPLFPDMKEFVLRNKIQNKIILLGRIHSQNLEEYTKIADCGINLLEEINLSKKYTTATKMFEYFQAGLPVITSDINENKMILAKYNVGILTKNNSEDLQNKIIEMKNSPNQKDFKLNSVNAAKEYNWENQRDQLYAIFK